MGNSIEQQLITPKLRPQRSCFFSPLNDVIDHVATWVYGTVGNELVPLRDASRPRASERGEINKTACCDERIRTRLRGQASFTAARVTNVSTRR
jgi:hypothetical protein